MHFHSQLLKINKQLERGITSCFKYILRENHEKTFYGLIISSFCYILMTNININCKFNATDMQLQLFIQKN